MRRREIRRAILGRHTALAFCLALLLFQLLLFLALLLVLLFLHRRHDRAATGRRTAPTGVHLFVRRRVFRCPLVRIVVQQLGAFGDVRQCRDEHPTIFLLDRFAVRRTGVIDVLRRPVQRPGIQHARAITDRKEKGVMPPHLVIGIPHVGLFLVDAFAEVFDDARALRDAPGRKCALALNLRRADGEGELAGSGEMSHWADAVES